MNAPAPPSHCRDQARKVERHVRELLTLLEQADAHTRLTTVADLRSICDSLLADALVEGMADARRDGWGLRRIASASHYSHEQVRTLLALTTPDATQREKIRPAGHDPAAAPSKRRRHTVR
ncbi:hypothetical protein ACFVGN_08975 [Streptomyces sp. NPDC057757]|uniref:hypothetical protein n=1 Tax=Streptomyces sp. NPDC057757 TaxID=3346241 RepID=UPI0036941AB8